MTLIACPVCFGASDAPMAVATNMGIFMMLGVVAVMLASFAGFFVYLSRRAKAMANAEPGHQLVSNPAKAGSHSELAGAHSEWAGAHSEWARAHSDRVGSHSEWVGSHSDRARSHSHHERDVQFGTNPQEGTA